jgi:hypothetical protein
VPEIWHLYKKILIKVKKIKGICKNLKENSNISKETSNVQK